MSMTIFLLFKLIGIICAYFAVTTMVPLVVFRRILKHKSFTYQVLMSFVAGNFFIIMMVQYLQLIKFCHKPVLILYYALVMLILWILINQIPVSRMKDTLIQNVKRIFGKQLGLRTVLLRIRIKFGRWFREYGRKLFKFIGRNIIEILLQLTLFMVLCYVYGKGIVETYGYSASDLPVHNYWINAMGDNNIFVAGVYPHGYHCIIYFLHTMFGFDTYIILSLFAFVQVVCVHFALLYFLRLSCKIKYVAYIGTFFYAISDFFMKGTFSRFSSTLPQEFGMIFILPSIWFGFEFFKLRYKEVKEGEKKKESWYPLIGFAMSFGLTLSAHFYNTIVAGFFCAAMAIGYIFLFVRKQYFGNIMITCLISVLVAIAPMGIAFATGTPLEGSLYWAQSVITGSGAPDEEFVINENKTDGNGVISEDEELIENAFEKTSESVETPQFAAPTLKERIIGMLESLKYKQYLINDSMKASVWQYNGDACSQVFWWLVLTTFIVGIVFLIFRKPCYAGMHFTVGLYLFLMAVVLSAKPLGLMMLMDPARACIYFSYAIPVLISVAVDGVVYMISIAGRFKLVGNVVSLACLVLAMGFLFGGNHIRTPLKAEVFETNEAVTCLTNIIRQNEDEMWTICSANDELRMGEDHGYHYDTITFLKNIENLDEDTVLTIPTPRVYFFVEKVPLDYAVSYEKSGQHISEEGASQELCYANGLMPYQGENRWVTMSRMYYWAESFREIYPREMSVYLETDRFVCYVVEQNTYSLFNFAIDYGYNTRK